MIPRAFRFRRFSLRLLALFLGLLFAALATTYLVVSRYNIANARDQARVRLDLAGRVVEATVRQRIEYLAGGAAIMSGDDAIKQVFIQQGDRRTLASVLVSYTTRIGAPAIGLYDTTGELLAHSDPTMDDESAGPFRFLIREATEKDLEQHSGFSYLKGQLHVLVVVPLFAPKPNVFAWFGLAFPIDRKFVEKIKDTTRTELSYVATAPPVLAAGKDTTQPRILATTLPAQATAPVVAGAIAAAAGVERRDLTGLDAMLTLPDDHYVTLFKSQEMLAEAPVTLVLQRPLSPELASARDLENLLLLTALAALAAATVLALVIARGVSEPVRQLAAHTQVIAAGDYTARVKVDRADEFGRLAVAFNAMSTGLAERDRVRDLLDKNVSPEVAAQLMRDGGAALGGEEREVTILFADLRGFTTLSEKLPPRELLTLLNRYLDRMSIEIERQGGVIDKYIGDAIMALFGAPVTQGDAADRALATLNAELAAEGKAPLALGIGVNTARVVAGNIGSQRRLNYSVIGDGVNVAARLQSLTRTPEYHTSIIASAATLAACRPPASDFPPRASPPGSPAFTSRPLGTVQVKGRAEPVEIFAVE